MPDPFRLRSANVLGLNSGTSINSLDWALVRCRDAAPRVTVLAAGEISLPAPLQRTLRDVAQAETVAKADLVRLDLAFGTWLGDQAQRLARRLKPRHKIHLIASHGQTVGHWPGKAESATLQIGDPDQIAKRTGIPVVSHFRHGDIAAGGQGAPLTPAVNRLLFARPRQTVGILNLGGIANLTVLPPPASRKRLVGTDCGPGNLLLDGAARALLNRPYDVHGRVGRTGHSHRGLLAFARRHPWFRRPLPASCGREEFGDAFLNALRRRFPRVGPPDFLATLAELSAWAVARALHRLGARPDYLYLTGGGVHNRRLVERLRAYVAPVPVESVAVLGFAPDTLEAVSFALLGYLFARGRKLDLRQVTGARRASVLGRLALP